MIPDAIPGGRPPGRPTSARDRRGDPAGPAGRLRVAALAPGFSPWPTICSYPPLGRKAVWAGVRRTLVVAGGERTGREASSSAAILDGRTLRTAGRKKIQRPRGRKAHPRPQTSHPDGSRGPAARGRGAGRRPSSGPRRGEGRPQAVPAALSLCRASWPTAAAAGKPVSRAQKAPVILDYSPPPGRDERPRRHPPAPGRGARHGPDPEAPTPRPGPGATPPRRRNAHRSRRRPRSSGDGTSLFGCGLEDLSKPASRGSSGRIHLPFRQVNKKCNIHIFQYIEMDITRVIRQAPLPPALGGGFRKRSL